MFIEFDRPAHFGARGRKRLHHGHRRCGDMGNGDFAKIHLHPLTSRGRESEACRIPIRKSAIPALIAEPQRLGGGGP